MAEQRSDEFGSRVQGLRRWLPARIAGSLLLALLGSSGAAADTWRMDQSGFDPQRPPQLVLTADGTPYVGYYDGGGRIIVRPPMGEPLILNPDPRPGAASGLALKAVGNDLYALWRERRQDVFTLLLRTPRQTEPVIIDNTTRPLSRFQLEGDPQGPLYVIWLGEGPPPAQDAKPAGNRYYLFSRYSPDGGKTWGEVRNLTADYERSIWPTLLTRGEQAYSFSWSEGGGKKRLVFTKTTRGEAWQTPTVIKEVGDVLLLRPQWVGERLAVFWLNRAEGKDFVLEGAFSDDQGAHWTLLTLEETRGLDLANLDSAAQGRDLYLTFSARPAASSEIRKQTVYLAHSPDGGAHWDTLKVLRHYPFNDTQALHPRVSAAPDGKVTVAWNDYRNIRGDLYFNFSDNAGADWLPDDRAIDNRGAAEDYLFPEGTALQQAGDAYYLLAAGQQDNSPTGAPVLLLHRFQRTRSATLDDPLSDPGSPAKTAALRTQAEQFWQTLVSGDYAKAYPLFDPFFRARFRPVDYLAATGRIVYHSFQIGQVQVYGNIGRVQVNYVYEIPTLTTPQGPFSKPRTPASATETWLFVDNAWYKEYRNEMGGYGYARY